MKSLFHTPDYREIRERLSRLTADDTPQWGKMTVGQMVWHCQFPLRVAVENKPVTRKPGLLGRLFKASMYSDKPWRKNLPTAPALKAREPKDFDTEFPRLMEWVEACYGVRDRETWNPHPMFGRLTGEQWGKMEFKHLDHHLRQFGR